MGQQARTAAATQSRPVHWGRLEGDQRGGGGVPLQWLRWVEEGGGGGGDKELSKEGPAPLQRDRDSAAAQTRQRKEGDEVAAEQWTLHGHELGRTKRGSEPHGTVGRSGNALPQQKPCTAPPQRQETEPVERCRSPSS